jgi:outer membrane receptor protein involved in Fe transport
MSLRALPNSWRRWSDPSRAFPGSTGSSSVAGRIEHYSDFGTTTNPKVGVTWEPVEGLALRGAYGTSFHAPGFFDVRQGPGLSQVVPLPVSDPTSPGGSSNVVALFGNNPAIGPERARTLTAGIDLRPKAVPGLALSMTWFDVSYRDRIFNPAVDAFTSSPSVIAMLADHRQPIGGNAGRSLCRSELCQPVRHSCLGDCLCDRCAQREPCAQPPRRDRL